MNHAGSSGCGGNQQCCVEIVEGEANDIDEYALLRAPTLLISNFYNYDTIKDTTDDESEAVTPEKSVALSSAAITTAIEFEDTDTTQDEDDDHKNCEMMKQICSNGNVIDTSKNMSPIPTPHAPQAGGNVILLDNTTSQEQSNLSTTLTTTNATTPYVVSIQKSYQDRNIIDPANDTTLSRSILSSSTTSSLSNQSSRTGKNFDKSDDLLPSPQYLPHIESVKSNISPMVDNLLNDHHKNLKYDPVNNKRNRMEKDQLPQEIARSLSTKRAYRGNNIAVNNSKWRLADNVKTSSTKYKFQREKKVFNSKRSRVCDKQIKSQHKRIESQRYVHQPKQQQHQVVQHESSSHSPSAKTLTILPLLTQQQPLITSQFTTTTNEAMDSQSTPTTTVSTLTQGKSLCFAGGDPNNSIRVSNPTILPQKLHKHEELQHYLVNEKQHLQRLQLLQQNSTSAEMVNELQQKNNEVQKKQLYHQVEKQQQQRQRQRHQDHPGWKRSEKEYLFQRQRQRHQDHPGWKRSEKEYLFEYEMQKRWKEIQRRIDQIVYQKINEKKELGTKLKS